MTNRAKMVLIASVLLALGVIASTIPLLKTAFEGEFVNIQILIFSLIIILLGIISVIGVYYSKVKKDQIERQLTKEFYEGYEIIKDSIMNSQLDRLTIKDIKEDILDMLILAQNSGKSFKETIGDAKKFSLDILEQYGKTPKYNIIHFIDSVVYMIMFVLGVTAVMWAEDVNKNFFNVKIDVSILVFFILISFIIVPYLKVNSISKNPKLIFLPIGIGTLYVISIELMRRFFYQLKAIKWFLEGNVNIVSSQIILNTLGIALVGLIVYKRHLKNTRKRGNFRQI